MVKAGKKKKDRIKKPAKIQFTAKELERLKQRIAYDITKKTNLLYLTVLAEEYGFDEDMLCETMETVTRYANYIDDKLVPLEKTSEIIYRKTGMKLTI